MKAWQLIGKGALLPIATVQAVTASGAIDKWANESGCFTKEEISAFLNDHQVIGSKVIF